MSNLANKDFCDDDEEINDYDIKIGKLNSQEANLMKRLGKCDQSTFGGLLLADTISDKIDRIRESKTDLKR